MLKHIGLNDLIGLGGLILAVIAIAKVKGFGDTVAASVGALIGLILGVTNVGASIHAAILQWLHIPTPSPYTYSWTSIGAFGALALGLLILVVVLAKGARLATIIAFLGTLLFVASTGLGQTLYNVIVGH